MLLKLAGIGKLFGARAVLRNISFEVHPGTVTLLVGANGAGKTTLLKIMAGLARPTVGTVERFCEDGGLGYLGHATFISPGLTALENLAFWSGMHGNPTDKATLSEALARVELAPFAEERAGTFSRGMAQRLNLARILLQSPPLLLLDEPGTGLDVRSLAILHREIAASRDRGAGIVWITHDVAGARLFRARSSRSRAFTSSGSQFLPRAAVRLKRSQSPLSLKYICSVPFL